MYRTNAKEEWDHYKSVNNNCEAYPSCSSLRIEIFNRCVSVRWAKCSCFLLSYFPFMQFYQESRNCRFLYKIPSLSISMIYKYITRNIMSPFYALLLLQLFILNSLLALNIRRSDGKRNFVLKTVSLSYSFI